MSKARFAALVTVAAGGIVASTRSAGSQSVPTYDPARFARERDTARATYEAERKHQDGLRDQAIARMKAEDPNNSPAARGTRWTAADNDRRLAEKMSAEAKARYDVEIASIGQREVGAQGLAKGQQVAAADDAGRKFVSQFAVPAAAMALLGVGAVVGGRGMRALGTLAGRSVQTRVGDVTRLGADAARITKGGGVITGTPRGDKLRGLLEAAAPAVAAARATPAAMKAGVGISGASTAIGVGSIGASFVVDDPTLANALRLEGAMTLGAGLYGFKALAAARGALPQVTARSLAQIQTAQTRLAREAAGYTSKQVAAKAAVGNARAAGQVVTATKATAAKRTSAGVARAQGNASVAVAQTKAAGDVAVSAATQAGRTRAAKHTADRTAFQASVKTKQARLNSAAATPASPVPITAPKPAVKAAAPARTRAPRQRAPYKDTWTVTRGGVTFTQTRKTPHVRKH